tara:strand:- start:400 stop:1983 length:1584 start_codon:yes stop_codon:yes gene_type:complete
MKTIMESVYKDIQAYDPTLTKQMVDEIIQVSFVKRGQAVILCKQAPAGFGKTTLAIRLLVLRLYEKGIRLVFFLGPQLTNIEDSTIRKHLMELGSQGFKDGIQIGYHINAKWENLNDYIDESEMNDGMIVLTMTDTSFRKDVKGDSTAYQEMLKVIKKRGFEDKTFVIADEGDVGSCSQDLLMRWTNGVKPKRPVGFKGKKYKALKAFSEVVSGVLDLTATLTSEQNGTIKESPAMKKAIAEEDYEITSKYEVIGVQPPKESLYFRLAGLLNIKYFERPELGALNVVIPEIIDTMSDTLTDQSRQDELAIRHNLPDVCNPKRVGLFKLEGTYLDKPKVTASRVYEELLDYTFPKHWDFELFFLCDDTRICFKVKDGEMEKIEDRFNNDSHAFMALRDKDDSLRFIFAIDKVARGADIPNIYDIMTPREYGMFNPDELAVVQTGVQFILRAIRIKVKIEDLLPYFDNAGEFKEYYRLVNGYNVKLPIVKGKDKSYWEGVIDYIQANYNSMSDIMEHCKEIEADYERNN